MRQARLHVPSLSRPGCTSRVATQVSQKHSGGPSQKMFCRSSTFHHHSRFQSHPPPEPPEGGSSHRLGEDAVAGSGRASAFRRRNRSSRANTHGKQKVSCIATPRRQFAAPSPGSVMSTDPVNSLKTAIGRAATYFLPINFFIWCQVRVLATSSLVNPALRACLIP